MAENYKELRSFSILGLDAKTVAATQIGTTENGGQSFYPMFGVVAMSAANTITLAGAISIGTNATSYNNIVPITTTTGLTTAGTMLNINMATAISKIAVNTGIFVNVTTGITGTSGTIDIHLFGFYQ